MTPSRRDRFGYWLDNQFSRGTTTLIRILGISALLLILVAGLVLWIGDVAVGNDETGFIEGVWTSLLRTLDPGTMGDDQGWTFRAVSLVVTLGGILILSTLIGVLSSGITERLEELNRGRSTVVESGHTVILGWSPKLFTLLEELVVANDNQSDACVVILADRDKASMDADIAARIPATRSLRVVCRTGTPSSLADLGRVAVSEAGSVVVLRTAEHGDAGVVRAVLAVEARPPRAEVPIVAELADHKRAEVLQAACRHPVLPVISEEWIGRITSEVCRNPGLAAVYADLLDFDGEEIYFEPIPQGLTGCSWGELVASVRDGCPIGLVGPSGDARLVPPSASRVAEGDHVIVVATDDGETRFHPGSDASPLSTPPATASAAPEPPLALTVLGWNAMGRRVLETLGHQVPPESQVHVLVDPNSTCPNPPGSLGNLSIAVTTGDTTDPVTLARYLGSAPSDRILLLAPTDPDLDSAESRVLLTLLELRMLLSEGTPPPVIVELLDEQDTALVGGVGHEEFIVGERLTALLMAQLAENPGLVRIFDELLGAHGADPVAIPLVQLGMSRPLSPRDLRITCADHDLAFIGVRTASGLHLNPSEALLAGLRDDPELVVLRRVPST
jgi:hypothetical protein